jgi:hypothetical protein
MSEMERDNEFEYPNRQRTMGTRVSEGRRAIEMHVLD